MPDRTKNQKGVTLLLSMLIMTSVVGIAIALSILIVNQFEFSANLDHALVSLYAAESGFEEGLNTIKINRDNTIENINSTLSDLNTSRSLDSLNAVWDTSGSSITQDYILDSLEQNLESSFDLEDAGSMELTWYDDCSGSSWLEVGYIAWLPTGSLAGTEPGKFVFGCDLDGGLCTTSVKNFPNEAYNYTLAISPITCNISYLKVRAYDEANLQGTQLSIGNKINLKSVGLYQDSQIAVSASIPYRLPPQGIFSFAIFSEATFEKR